MNEEYTNRIRRLKKSHNKYGSFVRNNWGNCVCDNFVIFPLPTGLIGMQNTSAPIPEDLSNNAVGARDLQTVEPLTQYQREYGLTPLSAELVMQASNNMNTDLLGN